MRSSRPCRTTSRVGVHTRAGRGCLEALCRSLIKVGSRGRCRLRLAGRLRYSVGYELTDQVRAAILKIPEDTWIAALATDDSERENGQIAEITTSVDLTGWPAGSRVIVRRERAHPGAPETHIATTRTLACAPCPSTTLSTTASG
jgi:hypothetical protein